MTTSSFRAGPARSDHRAGAFPAPTAATVTRLVPQQGRRDGEGAGERPVVEVQGTLALDLHAAPAPVAPELDPSHRSRVAHVDDGEVRAWSARFAQALVETVGGQRPVSQLVRWTAPAVFRDLERRTRLVQQAAGTAPRSVRPQVRSVHICRPTPRSAEVSVHVRHGHRSRALALRLERHKERWLCTVVEFG